MVKYSLIMEYLKKGNNYSQIATLCGCSRTTVWEVVKRIDYFKIQLADIDGIDEVGLRSILFPERVRKDEKYLVIDFKWEEFQMRKHQSSLRLCWRRYCKQGRIKRNETTAERKQRQYLEWVRIVRRRKFRKDGYA